MRSRASRRAISSGTFSVSGSASRSARSASATNSRTSPSSSSITSPARPWLTAACRLAFAAIFVPSTAAPPRRDSTPVSRAYSSTRTNDASNSAPLIRRKVQIVSWSGCASPPQMNRDATSSYVAFAIWRELIRPTA